MKITFGLKDGENVQLCSIVQKWLLFSSVIRETKRLFGWKLLSHISLWWHFKTLLHWNVLLWIYLYISLFKVIEECHLIKYSRFLRCPNLKTIFQRKGYNLVLPYYTRNSQNNPILKVYMLHGWEVLPLGFLYWYCLSKPEVEILQMAIS